MIVVVAIVAVVVFAVAVIVVVVVVAVIVVVVVVAVIVVVVVVVDVSRRHNKSFVVGVERNEGAVVRTKAVVGNVSEINIHGIRDDDNLI